MDISDLKTLLRYAHELVNGVAVMVVVAYLLTRIVSYQELRSRELSRSHRLLLVGVFGIFTIHATLSGITVLGAYAHVRNLGPVIAGLAGGPLVGIATGVIGGAHRYTLGGFTALPCSIATVLSGLAGGIMYRVWHGRSITIPVAATLMVGIECLHLALVLLLSRPFEQAVAVVKQIALPIIAANSAGIALFAYVFDNLVGERENQAARERIESELNIATEIQVSVLPRLFPPFPDRPEFEIYACMHPAREVGGDFYDFFLIDDDHLCVIIGDVSDKGVPAALFMMVARTYLRTSATLDPDPGDMLWRTNNLLHADNTSSMFVTIICAVLDLRTGSLRVANAGHNPPILFGPRDDARFERVPAGFVAGGMADTRYPVREFTLAPGDTFFTYTDGVTEARSFAAGMYGNERLLQGVAAAADRSLDTVVETIRRSVMDFAAGVPQFDDITMLALRYQGPDEPPRPA